MIVLVEDRDLLKELGRYRNAVSLGGSDWRNSDNISGLKPVGHAHPRTVYTNFSASDSLVNSGAGNAFQLRHKVVVNTLARLTFSDLLVTDTQCLAFRGNR